MPKTQVTLTQHFTESGNAKNTGKPWTRNDFKTADGVRYQTFDAQIAAQAKALLNAPVELEYEIEERGQYVNNTLLGVTALGSPAEVAEVQAVAALPQIRGVDRGGGLVRAIEFISVSGESIVEAYDNGSLFELADAFAEYSAFGRSGVSSLAPAEA